MKRLLAYSSIENIGIIVAGIGLAILFKAYGKTLLAAITLTAVLYHCAQPRVLQEPAVPRDRLGAARDARSAASASSAASSTGCRGWRGSRSSARWPPPGMPPLNGFVSEWLLLQAFLFTPSLPQSFVNMLVPLAAAALVLVRGAGGLRDGQVLRHHLPRPAARGEPRLREGRGPVRARGARLPRGGLRPARRASRST